MIRLTPEQFITLSCLADYDLTGYEILDFARELGYAIPLENLFPTLQELLELGLIQSNIVSSIFNTTTPVNMPIFSVRFELTQNGKDILIDEMTKVDLLIKRVRKQVRTLQ